MRRAWFANLLGLGFMLAAASACDQLVSVPTWPSTPDTNVPATKANAWVQRAARDARDEGMNVEALAPLNVIVNEGQAFVWFRNYDDCGEQVMLRYEGEASGSARLLEFFDRSPTRVEASPWEQARVRRAVKSDPEVQLKVGQPVTILGVTIDSCGDEPPHSVIAHARLAGPIIAAPADVPGLAPIATVDMTALTVDLFVPDFPISNP